VERGHEPVTVSAEGAVNWPHYKVLACDRHDDCEMIINIDTGEALCGMQLRYGHSNPDKLAAKTREYKAAHKGE
jgi:hypothetical protein